jgi:hypothetical protein
MLLKYIRVRARSANVGSGIGGKSVAGPGPACFLTDELVIRGLVSPMCRRRVDLQRRRGPGA